MKKTIIWTLLLWFVVLPLVLLGWVAQPFVFVDKMEDVPVVEASALKRDVQMLSHTLAERNYLNIETLNRAAAYIRSEFEQSADKVELQTFEVDGDQYHNVIAHFGSGQGQPMIIGAHYDAFEETSGADDNASGVAGLLALARLLKQHPPKVPVQLIAYTLEEPPHFRTADMGSRRHATMLAESGTQPRLVLALEMIGFFSDAPNSQRYPVEQMAWLYPTEANFIAVVGHFAGTSETRMVKSAMRSATDLPVLSINAPAMLPGIDFSDHASYWQYEMPAIMVTDTAFYRNPHYHQPTDTPETLDYQRMAKVVQGVYGVIQQME